MEDKNIEKNKSRLKIYYSLLITIICIIGVSFAWFKLYLSQTENNTLASRTCFNTSLTEETSKIALTDEFPIVDEKGLKKTPFTFTVKNNCSSYVKMYITIDSTYRTSTSSSYLKDNYIKVNLSPKGTTDNNSVILGKQSLTDLDNNSKGYILISTGLKANEEKSYDLRIWMDSAVTKEQGLNKSWSGKIVVVTSAAQYTPILNETVLAKNKVKTPLTTPGSTVSIAGEALLASTEDDYGTSYYFRGAVKNNYVQFANKCWRIVRINGDSSVKLILHNDNTSGASNPCSSANNSTTAAFAHHDDQTRLFSAFNYDYGDNAYVGFMHGVVGASDYASAHANTNKSTILANLETWYTNNLASYADKLADTIWCNDKSTVSGGLGYGTNDTNYGVYNRLFSTKQPTLKCPNDNNGGKLSKFTVNDTTNGNGNLTYKIGLLTIDELVFAGYATSGNNVTTYLQENAADVYWTLSPLGFSGGTAFVWNVHGDSGNVNNDYAGNAFVVRPAISLVSDITISGGSGTSEDPYVIN